MKDTSTKHLSEIADSVFLLLSQMRQVSDLGDPEVLQRRASKVLADFERDAKTQGYSDSDINDATFALVASMDEAVASSAWHGKEQWQGHPLAVQYFASWIAGEEFFQRLEKIRAHASKRVDVVEIYYLCLTTGFKGSYGLHGPDKLKQLVRDVYGNLHQYQKRNFNYLSPHGQRTEELAQQVSSIPIWTLVTSAVGIAVLFFLVVRTILGSHANKVLENLDHVMKQARF